MLAKSKQRKTAVLTLLALVIFSVSSCGIGLLVRGAAKKTITVENKVVPPNFIQSHETLIVLLWGNKSYDKCVKRAFDKYYTGKKIYIGLNTLKTDEKYQDLDKYPFVFSQGPSDKAMYEEETYGYTFSGSRPFHIYDRRSGEFYRAVMRSGFYARIIQAYAMKLNEFVK